MVFFLEYNTFIAWGDRRKTNPEICKTINNEILKITKSDLVCYYNNLFQ